VRATCAGYNCRWTVLIPTRRIHPLFIHPDAAKFNERSIGRLEATGSPADLPREG